MPILAIILLVVGAAVLALGVVLFANGERAGTREQDVEPGGAEGTKQELQQRPWKPLFAMTGSSVKVFTNAQASHDDRLKAGGAFCFLVGIVLVCLAVLAFIAWML